MSDTRGLLDRISAFRKRLDSTPNLIPEAIPIAENAPTLSAEVEAFRESVRRVVGKPIAVAEGPIPQFTDRAQRILSSAKQLLDRQRSFGTDPLFAALAVEAGDDPLVAFHRETLAVLDVLVRTAQGFPDSAGAQLKLCDGLAGLLEVVKDRLAVQDRALARRRSDAERIDRLAAFMTAIHTNQAATLQTVAGLAEELLAEARQGKPIRYVAAPIASTRTHADTLQFPAPARYVAAHALNVAQIVARIVPHDYEWSGRPLLPVVTALIMDSGMLLVPQHLLAKAEALSADERRTVEAHPKVAAELLLWRFPTIAGPLAAAIATHHERGDGTGYPNGLKAPDLPQLGRLLRVADVYAALNEERPHRPASDPREAITELLLMAEQGQVDKDFAEYVLNLALYPTGTVVELTDGHIGVVVANHPNRVDPRSPGRPVVAILADPDGALLARVEHIDLAAASHGSIVRGVPAARAREILGGKYPDLV
jgi:HD-GYP domain-containing protein (c-di-GMP phosphodiesterase class II)